MAQLQLPRPDKAASWTTVAGQSILSLLLLGAAVAVFLLLGEAPPPPLADPDVEVPTVSVVAAAPHEDGLTLVVDGVVRPYRDLAVAAESGGRVTYKSPSCQVGSVVAAGDVLIRVDPRDYQFEVQRLEKELEQAKVSVDELEVQLYSTQQQIELAKRTVELNERELRRAESVRTPGVITESELDSARRNVVTSEISLQTQSDQRRLLEASLPRLKSAVDRIDTQLATAQLALDRCVVRAPIDGVITEEHVEQDGYLQKGSLVFSVRDISRLDVRCSLRADQLSTVWASSDRGESEGFEFPETPVTVIYELGPRRYAWDGVLARFDGAGLDPETRMAPCVVHVNDPRSVRLEGDENGSIEGLPPTLLVGMFVEVQVHLRPRQTLLSLPSASIQPGNRVWVVEGDKLSERRVSIAGGGEETSLVYADAGGLSAGERVVVSPLASPTDGAEVRVLPVAEDPS